MIHRRHPDPRPVPRPGSPATMYQGRSTTAGRMWWHGRPLARARRPRRGGSRPRHELPAPGHWLPALVVRRIPAWATFPGASPTCCAPTASPRAGVPAPVKTICAAPWRNRLLMPSTASRCGAACAGRAGRMWHSVRLGAGGALLVRGFVAGHADQPPTRRVPASVGQHGSPAGGDAPSPQRNRRPLRQVRARLVQRLDVAGRLALDGASRVERGRLRRRAGRTTAPAGRLLANGVPARPGDPPAPAAPARISACTNACASALPGPASSHTSAALPASSA